MPRALRCERLLFALAMLAVAARLLCPHADGDEGTPDASDQQTLWPVSLGSIFDKKRGLEGNAAERGNSNGAASQSDIANPLRQAVHQQPAVKSPTKQAPSNQTATKKSRAKRAVDRKTASKSSLSKSRSTKPAQATSVIRTTNKASSVRRASAQVPVDESPYLSPQAGPPHQGIPEGFGGPEDEPEPESDHPLLDRWCKAYERLKEPVEGNSWLARPLYIGGMVGGIWGDEIIRNRVGARSGTLGLFLVGWESSKYNGFDIRLGGCAIDTFNEHPPLNPRNNDFRLFDVGWLWYPWGDNRFRPFTRLGLGLQRYTFLDDTARRFDVVIPAIPFGLGAKYLFNRHIALRMELIDNVGLGSGLDLETMHNAELSFGLEFHFGGYHKSYWPWDPGRFPW